MTRVVHTISLLVTAVVLSAQQSGQLKQDRSEAIWAPPDLSLPDELPRPTVPRPMITRLAVAGWVIELEKTELQQAQKRFGATIGESGDAGEERSWLCLYGKDNGGLWGLWLMSGEIDGPSIGSFQWQRLPSNARMDPRCRPLGKSGVELPLGVHLGMTRREAERVLGKPTELHHDSALYSHEHNFTVKHEPYTADNNLFVTYQNDVMWSLLVNFTVSS